MLVTTFERKGYQNAEGQWVGSARPGYQLTYVDLQTEHWTWNPQANAWSFQGPFVAGVFPSGKPKQLPHGDNWVMGGFDTHGHPVVVRWHHSDMESPKTTVIPLDVDPVDPLRFGETDILIGPERLVALSRYQTNKKENPGHGFISVSQDNGATWSKAMPTTFPMAASRPCLGRLSSGEPYLIFNPVDRSRLAIATGPKDTTSLDQVFLVRDSPPPTPRFPAFSRPQWSYPIALEHNGQLLIAYSASKEDAAITTIPIRSLQRQQVTDSDHEVH